MALGGHDGLPGHVGQIGTHHNINGHAGPEKQRAGNEAAADAEEAPEYTDKETDADQKQRVDGYPGDWEVHDYSSRSRPRRSIRNDVTISRNKPWTTIRAKATTAYRFRFV